MRHTLARDISPQARRLGRRKGLTDRVRQALQSVAAFNMQRGTSGIDLGVEVVPGRSDSGDVEVDLLAYTVPGMAAYVHRHREEV